MHPIWFPLLVFVVKTSIQSNSFWPYCHSAFSVRWSPKLPSPKSWNEYVGSGGRKANFAAILPGQGGQQNKQQISENERPFISMPYLSNNMRKKDKKLQKIAATRSLNGELPWSLQLLESSSFAIFAYITKDTCPLRPWRHRLYQKGSAIFDWIRHIKLHILIIKIQMPSTSKISTGTKRKFIPHW